MKYTALILIILSFSGFACSQSRISDTEIQRNYSSQVRIEDATRVTVKNFNGNIDLKTVPGSQIAAIEAVIKARGKNQKSSEEFQKSIEIVFQKRSDTIAIETVIPKLWTMPGKIKRPVDFSVDINLEIPEGMNIECTSEKGNVNLTGANGSITATNQQGNIIISDSIDNVTASATDGNLTVKVFKEYDVSMRLSTRDGNIDLELPTSINGSIEFLTLSGNINLKMPESYEPNIKANSTRGDIKIEIGSRIATNIDLTSENGKVIAGMPISTETAGGKKTSGTLVGMLGSGGGKITAKTKNGNIYLDYTGESENVFK
jgi:DUF4097 and DUF4098 domain-containing protein YvlB